MPVLMELKRVIINEIHDQHVIVLREPEGERAFPIMIGIFTPTITGQLGYSDSQPNGTFDQGAFFTSDGSDDVEENYTYWNAGVKLAVEKFTFDLRYWDTNLAGNLSDERFFFSAAVTLP